jgi:maltooligosyltrehalose trehalohydrolase
VREGRRAEVAQFPAFADPVRRERIPDPNAAETFAASVPHSDPQAATEREALYRRLIALRNDRIVPRLDGTHSLGARVVGPKAVLAHWRLGDGATLTIGVNLDAQAVSVDLPDAQPIFASSAVEPGRLPGHCTCAFLADAAASDV